MKIILRGDDTLEPVDNLLRPLAVPPVFPYGKKISVELDFYHANGEPYAESELDKYANFRFGADIDFSFITPAAALTVAGFSVSGNTLSFNLWTAGSRFKQLLNGNKTAPASAEFKAYLADEITAEIKAVFPVTLENSIIADSETQAPPQFQFSIDGAADWHEIQTNADRYCRVNRNDGSEWSVAIKLPDGIVGAPGTDGIDGTAAPLTQIQFSIDGAADWHTPFAAGDFFLRFSVDGGASWTNAIRFIGIDGNDGTDGLNGANGADGADAPLPQFQFSIDGATDWHTPFADGDKYIRFSVDNATTWTNAIKFVGEDLQASAPVTLPTSGNVTIDASLSDKFILEPSAAVTLDSLEFKELSPVFIKIINGGNNVSFPSTWIWKNASIPLLAGDGFNILRLMPAQNGETLNICAENIAESLNPGSYLVLNLSMDGNDGDIAFTDESSSGHAVTTNGDAQVDTAIKNSGTGSLLVDGSGDYLSIPDSDDFNFGEETDFMIEFDFYAEAQTQSQPAIMGSATPWTAGQMGISFDMPGNENKVGIVTYSSLGDMTSGTLNLQTWYNVKFSRKNTVFYLYINDVLQKSSSTRYAVDFSGNGALWIGSGGGLNPFKGNIDNFKIYKGYAIGG